MEVLLIIRPQNSSSTKLLPYKVMESCIMYGKGLTAHQVEDGIEGILCYF